MTIEELASELRATMNHCNAAQQIVGVASLDRARANEAAVIFDALPTSLGDAGLLIVGLDVQPPPDRPVLVVAEPRVAFAQLTTIFAKPVASGAGIHPTAVIAPDCTIDPSAHIGPHCVIESGAKIGADVTLVAQVYIGRDVHVGSNTTIMPGTTLYPDTHLGERVIVQAGARLGCDGFGFVTESPEHPKVHSLAGLRIHDDVEIGANTTIQRGTLSDTVIGRGSKVGDGCNVGHNVELGEYCLLAGNITIGGTARIGNAVHLAMGVTVRDHATIGDHSVVMMGSHVTADVPPHTRVLGSPAIPEHEQKARVRALRRLVDPPRTTSE